VAELPKYLTSPGHAVAQRKRWENRLVEQMQYVAEANDGSRWSTIVRKMTREIGDLPPWSHQMLTQSQVEDDPYDEIERLGRTIATGSYNVHVLSRLVDAGIPRKMWLTRHDAKVRPAHREADGQTVPLSKPFIVGGQQLQYPAHSATADISLWFGCRCMVVGRP
jgi:hypothetical protein